MTGREPAETKVLVLEDEKSFASLLACALERQNLKVKLAETLEEGIEQVRAEQFDVVLADIYLGAYTALDFIPKSRAIDPHLPIIVMTSKHTTETTIQATRLGAYDYFPKPDVMDLGEGTKLDWPWALDLTRMIKLAAENKRHTDAANATREEDKSPLDDEEMIGKGRAMQEVFKTIGRAAASDGTVLIRGETGTGKELAARALYHHSARREEPFIVVNSAAIPETLLESELFGHEKGAFTDACSRKIGRFEQANHGTVFLDEIGDMSFALQQKLLRVLQEKTIERVGGRENIAVDVRVIAATHRDLEAAIQNRLFRSDLYFRLNVLTIHLPPLRERREDIPDLVRHFLRKCGPELGLANPLISAKAIELLCRQPWPGNVRHLRNVVRKALLLSRGLVIREETLRAALAEMGPPQPAAGQSFTEFVRQLLAKAQSGEQRRGLRDEIADAVDAELYKQAIRRAEGDQSKAARWVGVSRPTMLEKLRRFGYHPTEAKKADGESNPSDQSAPEKK